MIKADNVVALPTVAKESLMVPSDPYKKGGIVRHRLGREEQRGIGILQRKLQQSFLDVNSRPN